MRSAAPSSEQTTSYYRAAFACLQHVEARRPTRRRFGADADARWKAFKGHLSASERIDLLLRDANAEWPGAFGAREVFALHSVAEDEAFGADWQALDAVQGEALWRELAGQSGLDAPREALAAVARAWRLNLEAEAGSVLEDLRVERVLGHGASSRVLEVTRLSDAQRFALKVSLNEEHDSRLQAEAPVLDQLRHPRIVKLVQARVIAERVCLLLELAGERTLHDGKDPRGRRQQAQIQAAQGQIGQGCRGQLE